LKLITAIIENDMIYDVVKALSAYNFRTTKLSSTGGFLKKGNTTLLIGVEDYEVQKVLDIIEEISKNRAEKPEDDHSANANIFILDLDDRKRF